jgi:pyruvate/2-oxoglutarate dehydrogenase complex dihydrolipoamide dehydrogenase (E3) component
MTHDVDVIVIGAGIAGLIAADGLVSAYGHVSARAGASMLITPAADRAIVTESAIVNVSLEASSLPKGAPAEGAELAGEPAGVRHRDRRADAPGASRSPVASGLERRTAW